MTPLLLDTMGLIEPLVSKYIEDYIKNCPKCQRYKATNLKPAGLLQTPAPTQRFETIAMDLVGPLPETNQGFRWIFIVEDTASKWIEIFPLIQATAIACAQILIDEIFFRYGTPRRMISDNGVQFISEIMQQIAYCLEIHQSFIPLYHPESILSKEKIEISRHSWEYWLKTNTENGWNTCQQYDLP